MVEITTLLLYNSIKGDKTMTLREVIKGYKFVFICDEIQYSICDEGENGMNEYREVVHPREFTCDEVGDHYSLDSKVIDMIPTSVFSDRDGIAVVLK